MMRTVPVQYSCKVCKTVEREVQVRVRGKLETVNGWLEAVRATVGRDHSRQLPLCHSKVCDLKIPLGAERIGDGVTH